jgi:arsenate reductase
MLKRLIQPLMVTLFHNPVCSKSRAAVTLLGDRDIEFDTIQYLDEPLSESEIIIILNKLTTHPETLVRTADSLFAEIGGPEFDLGDAAVVATLLAENPKLMQRPLLVTDRAAAIGRPLESLLKII